MSFDSSEDARVQSRIERIVNRLPGLVYRCRIEEGFQMVLEYASSGSMALIGIPREELMETRANIIEQMTVPADLDRLLAQEHDSIRTRRPYQLMYRLRLPDGRIKWVWDQGEPIYNEEGRAVCLEGIMMDVSEQKFLELTLQDENRRLKQAMENRSGMGEMVGRSGAMRRVYDLIVKAAGTDSSVLILGETGCGKDLVAKTIHSLSGCQGRYVPVNCGAIPENLLESEFFGHTRGAFTGATMAKEGLVAAADRGTLFLDEVGELPLHLQVKLLRLLETRAYTPLGSTQVRHSSFRLVAATHRKLADMVREGKMRADFYYRVNVLTITLPPLRERTEDIPLLVDSWCEKHGVTLDVPRDIRLAMAGYAWPGNIRELHNFLARLATFGRQAASFLVAGDEAPPATELEAGGAGDGADMNLDAAVRRLEERMILQALERTRWHRGRAAELLGINLRTMQRRMKRLGITAGPGGNG